MHHFFTETIKVRTYEGPCGKWPRPVLVDAIILYPFAIHPSTERYTSVASTAKLFSVTHLPSGGCLFRHRTLSACAGFVGGVGALDWSFFDREPDCRENCRVLHSEETAMELFPEYDEFVRIKRYWAAR